jgi:hypothetical protein
MDRRLFLATAATAVLTAGTARARAISVGRVVEYPVFKSAHVDPRRVTVWLPPGYDTGSAPHAVLYMHDGQNLFDPDGAPFGEWGVDEVLSDLIAKGQVPQTLVVGVWNTAKRYIEYGPAALVESVPEPTRSVLRTQARAPLESDGYLKFLVEELKPFIDQTYRTLPGRDHTVLMGSSMGGLISLYGGLNYPEVFGAVGCVSTHWPLGGGEGPGISRDQWRADVTAGISAYLDKALPSPPRTRFYFDHGDQNLDSNYAPYQARVDAIFAAKGYRKGREFESLAFPGADHNEPSWNRRLTIPLKFLLNPAAPAGA